MPEVNQLFFTHKEVLELLIKKGKIHQGRWMLAANFGFTAGNFGPGPAQLSPGAIVAILGVGLQRAAADTLEEMTLDAAVVNPQSASGHRSVKRRKI
jgi:hypothetical protein